MWGQLEVSAEVETAGRDSSEPALFAAGTEEDAAGVDSGDDEAPSFQSPDGVAPEQATLRQVLESMKVRTAARLTGQLESWDIKQKFL